MDDYYEYRHVILPKEIYKKMQRGKLLTESVYLYLFRNGEPWEFNNQEDGSITNFIDHNHIFYFSEDQREVIHKLAFPHPVSSHHLTLFAIDMPLPSNDLLNRIYRIHENMIGYLLI
jgi:hypothetical protein